jgi:hypothetical protein
MILFDVRYLYLFLDAYSMYIKGIIVFTRKKNIYPKNPSKYFLNLFIFLKKLHTKKKKKTPNI